MRAPSSLPRFPHQASALTHSAFALQVLAIVGGLHTFKIIKEEAPPPSATAPGLTATMPPAGDGLDFSRPLETAGVGSSGPEWKEMGPMTQQSS